MNNATANQSPQPPEGLSAPEAAQRLQQDGPNVLASEQRRTWRMILRETLREPMFMLLLAAGTLYLTLGERQEGLVMFGLVLVVLSLTLYQEGRTEHALRALRELTSPRALVLRDGVVQRIAGAEVVRGDLLVLVQGDRVAADACLLNGADVQVDESLLTGESVPVDKSTDGETRLFAGTLLVNGHATARVTATGAHSEIGRIGSLLQGLVQERSPLKRQTARLVQSLALIAFATSAALVLMLGVTRGDWMAALLAGIALAMAMLPEEFTVVLTVLPALGAWRLAQHQVLTRRIAAIETLGAATVLCVDKTGTLTENRMTVVALYAPAAHAAPQEHLALAAGATTALPDEFHALVEYAILASMAQPYDPMEQAFHRLGQVTLGQTEHLHQDWTLLHEYGLTPELRAMAQVWQATQGEAHVVAAKGGPEAIADLCHLDAAMLARLTLAADAMAAQGLRVLGVARAQFVGQQWPAAEHDFEFTFVGLLGLADPLRAGVKAAVADCHSAGIRVMMITGDYPLTARAIAAQAQIVCDGATELLTGDELTRLDDAQLQARIPAVTVCARIAPEQKLRLVQALKRQGDIVAMTGDGVNDAPALKAAHVGVAMGGRGTDVAREAASIVVLDDNFASIVQGVRLGRRIYDNLYKAMSYILAVHVPIAGLALVPVLLGWPVLLLPMHIACLELVIDPACSLVFEGEPAEADLMQRPPRDPEAPLFGRQAMLLALVRGLGVLLVVLLGYGWAIGHLPEPQARAFGFTALVVGNLALILSNRSSSRSLWFTLRVPNRTLWLVTGFAATMLGLTLYVPPLAQLFQFAPLSSAALAGALALGLLGVFWFEVLKLSRRWHPAAPQR